jgi:hypothetical protein
MRSAAEARFAFMGTAVKAAARAFFGFTSFDQL